MHPDYNPRLTGLDDDICLCRLRTPLVWSNTIQQISIPPQGFVVPHYAQTTYAGWGQLWVSFYTYYTSFTTTGKAFRFKSLDLKLYYVVLGQTRKDLTFKSLDFL